MGGIKQVCVSKKFALLLFLTGMCLQIEITAVWIIYHAGQQCPVMSLYRFLLNKIYFPALPQRIDVLK